MRRLSFFVALSAFYFIFTSVAAPAAERLRSSECGGSDIIRFVLKDEVRTKFFVPEAYLENTFSSRLKVKDPADLINIVISKVTFDADCENSASKEMNDFKRNQNFLSVSIRPYSKNEYPSLISNQKRYLNKFIRNDGAYKIFRSEKYLKTGILNGEKDLLLPNDPHSKENHFIVCNRNISSDKIISCRVNQKITSSVYVTYVINPSNQNEIGLLLNGVFKKIIRFVGQTNIK